MRSMEEVEGIEVSRTDWLLVFSRVQGADVQKQFEVRRSVASLVARVLLD